MSNAAPTRPTSKPPARFTPTMALIIAGGVAAGIGLARPSASTGSAAPPGSETGSTVAAAPRGGGYLGDRNDDATPAQPLSPAAPAAVTIRDFAFAGSAVAAAGQQVAVNNADGAAHTLTADGGEFDTGTIAGGDSSGFSAPGVPGTYTYFCTIHPSMQGSITVQ